MCVQRNLELKVKEASCETNSNSCETFEGSRTNTQFQVSLNQIELEAPFFA